MPHIRGLMTLLVLIAALGSCIFLSQISGAVSGTVQAPPGQGVGDYMTLGDSAPSSGLTFTITPSHFVPTSPSRPPSTTFQGRLSYTGSGNWQMMVDSTSTPKGYATEVDSSGNPYGGNKLINPMRVRAQNDNPGVNRGKYGPEIDLSNPNSITTPLITDSGTNKYYNIYYYQTISPDEIALQHGHVYRIIVIFTAQRR